MEDRNLLAPVPCFLFRLRCVVALVQAEQQRLRDITDELAKQRETEKKQTEEQVEAMKKQLEEVEFSSSFPSDTLPLGGWHSARH